MSWSSAVQVFAPGVWVEFGPPGAIKHMVDRRRLILDEAARYQRLSDAHDALLSLNQDDINAATRDAYRDMAAALRMLADERGT